MAFGCMNSADASLNQDRMFNTKLEDIPSETLHLFWTNVQVYDFNKRRLATYSMETAVLNAFDRVLFCLDSTVEYDSVFDDSDSDKTYTPHKEVLSSSSDDEISFEVTKPKKMNTKNWRSRRDASSSLDVEKKIRTLGWTSKAKTRRPSRARLQKRMDRYVTRVQWLKNHIEKCKLSGSYHEEMVIEERSTGNSHQTMFGRFLGDDVTNAIVEDG
jgi:hypothetical protein